MHMGTIHPQLQLTPLLGLLGIAPVCASHRCPRCSATPTQTRTLHICRQYTHTHYRRCWGAGESAHVGWVPSLLRHPTRTRTLHRCIDLAPTVAAVGAGGIPPEVAPVAPLAACGVAAGDTLPVEVPPYPQGAPHPCQGVGPPCLLLLALHPCHHSCAGPRSPRVARGR
jgi:hypothetical protein